MLNGGRSHAATDSHGDVAAAKRAEHEQVYLFADALLLGEYPKLLADHVSPWIEEGDLAVIGRDCDYLGWNYYSRNVVRAGEDDAFELTTGGDTRLTAMGWEVYPRGLQEIIQHLAERYNLPPLYITENGAAFDDKLVDDRVADPERIEYLRDHLVAVNTLLREGIDIRGYVCWSLMDNFEWAEGYSKRFGLVHVDYATQQRTIKNSGRAFAQLLKYRTTEAARRRNGQSR